MRSTFFVAAGLIVLGLGSQAFAASAQDAAYDSNQRVVSDSNGGCVRTQWQGATDACGAAPAPKPAPVVKAVVPVDAEHEARTLYFDFNKATLTPASIDKLNALAKIINESTSIEDVVIHGYTDQIGSDSYNTALAEKRVAAVKAYLDGKSRLKAEGDIRGLGKASPEASCEAVAARAEKIKCMAKERRVEIEFDANK